MASKDGKTEKPTGKRRGEARQKGQVARSADLNSTIVLLGAVAGLAIAGPMVLQRLATVVTHGIALAGDPTNATDGLSGVAGWGLGAFARAVAPIPLVCLGAGLLANVLQVRPTIAKKALKADFKRLDPKNGLKRIFGKDGYFEVGKALVKLTLIGAVAFWAVWPKLRDMSTLVGLPPYGMLLMASKLVVGIGFKIGGALLLVALGDYFWQRRRVEDSLKMSKDEVKQERRQSDVAPEIKGAIRRRQFEQARKRMLAEVPTADVVVVNPTHYAVALRYDGKRPAPEVVAKGMDHVAAAIRRVADEHGVPIVSNPPLARTLYREVELNQMIPEDFYAAVAEVLAFVFRMAKRNGRRALGQ